MEVILQEGENLERALRKFKRKVQRSGLYSELRKRRFYEKPSAQRKRKREAAIRRERRRQRRGARSRSLTGAGLRIPRGRVQIRSGTGSRLL